MAGVGAAIRGFSKKYFGKKTSSTISSVKPGKKLKQKRDIQDNVVSDKDKVMKNLDAEGKLSVRTKVPLKNTNKEVSDILDKKK
jgi:hypothetical protein